MAPDPVPLSDGRMKWQASTGYGKRSLVETAIGRYKAIIGRRLRARSVPAQQTEVAIGCAFSTACLLRTPEIRAQQAKGSVTDVIKDRNPPSVRSVRQRRLERDIDATLGKQVFNVTQAQRKPIIEPPHGR